MLSAILKANHARGLGKQSVVLAPANVCSCLKWCSALAHDDAAAQNRLSAEDLYAESLGV